MNAVISAKMKIINALLMKIVGGFLIMRSLWLSKIDLVALSGHNGQKIFACVGVILWTITGENCILILNFTNICNLSFSPGTPLGHKTGSSDRTADGVRIADNDAGFVLLPDGRRYCVAVFVTDSRASDSVNAAIAAAVSRAAYEWFAATR